MPLLTSNVQKCQLFRQTSGVKKILHMSPPVKCNFETCCNFFEGNKTNPNHIYLSEEEKWSTQSFWKSIFTQTGPCLYTFYKFFKLRTGFTVSRRWFDAVHISLAMCNIWSIWNLPLRVICLSLLAPWDSQSSNLLFVETPTHHKAIS